jgi:hypothetical protein
MGEEYREPPTLRDGEVPSDLLARLEEILAPAVIEVGGDAFSATEFGHALLTAQAFENDADLLFGRELPAGPAADLSYCRFSRLLLPPRHLETLLGAKDPVMCLLAQTPSESESC